MNRRFYLPYLLFFLFLSFLSRAQSLQWAKKIDGFSNDNGSKNVTDANGNVFIAGSIQGSNVDFDPSPATFNLSSAGSKDFFLAKYDKDGNLKWAFRVGGSQTDDMNDLAIDHAGNLVITGFFRGQNVDFDPSAGTAFLNSNGEDGGDPGYGGDIFVAKYDTDGNYKWAFNIGGLALGESGVGINVDNNNNVLVTGYFGSKCDFDPSAGKYELDNATGPLFVAKYGPDAQFQWAFNTGQPGYDNSGYDIAADQTGNVIVTGFFQGSNIDFDPSSAVHALSSNGGFEFFLAKYSPGGQYLWAFSAGSSGTDVGRNLITDLNNNIYVTGDFQNSADFDPGPGSKILNSNGSSDIFLLKYDANGQLQWGNNMGGPYGDHSWSIALDNSNNLLIAGDFQGAVDFDPSSSTALLTSSGSADGFVAKYSAIGQYICSFKIGGVGYDGAYSVANNGTYCNVTGTFGSPNTDFDPGPGTSLMSAMADDAFFAKYDWNIVAPNGTITGGQFCSGQKPMLTFTASAGTGPYSLSIFSSTNATPVVYSNIQSGVPFAINPQPTQTTTYTLSGIKDANICAPQTNANQGVLVDLKCLQTEICDNGIDDDGDGLIDCADPDCLSCTSACGPVPTLNAKIFNTANNGQGGLIQPGASDRHWMISTSLNGSKTPAMYTGNCAPGTWTPSPYPDAGWITDPAVGICGSIIPQNDPSPRYFSTTFDLPALLASSLKLSFDVYADNYIGEVYVNGVPQGINFTSGNLYCAGCNKSFTLSSGFVAGTNTITILVLQQPIPEFPRGQLLGLLVSASSKLDSDGDGVVDGIDQCPGTPPGVTVDAKGCFKLSLTSNAPLCTGDSLVLKASNAGNGSIYQWTTPTGKIITGQNIVIKNITALDQGKYKLEITDVYSCIHKDSIQVSVNSKPIVTITPNSSICSGGSIQLNASGGNSYKWSPQIGLSNNAIANPVASPTTTITYQVVVKNNAGCADSAQTTITINGKPFISTAAVNPICQKDSVQLQATGGNSYQWIPATGLNNSLLANPKASPAVSTVYKVIASNTDGCKDSTTINVTVNPLPAIQLTPDASLCKGKTAQLSASGGSTYKWSPATGLSNPLIANPIANPAATTTYGVTVTTINGCVDSAKTTLTVNPKPVATISAPVTICSGDSTLLQSGGGTTFQWKPATGLSNANMATPQAFPLVTTDYTLITFNASGCTDTAYTKVTVTNKPVLSLTDKTICINETASFDATLLQANSYQWSNGTTNPVLSVTQQGKYWVTVYINSCINPVRDTVQLNVLGLPTVSLPTDTTICNFQVLHIPATGTDISNYLWSTGSSDPFIDVNKEGTYSIVASNQCGNAIDDINVKVDICADDLYFPNGFTPNDDGKNDLFKAAYFRGVIAYDYELQVYNRWGRLVFLTNKQSAGWDGRWKGQLQPNDVFVWQVRYSKTKGGPIIKKSGTVVLIR